MNDKDVERSLLNIIEKDDDIAKAFKTNNGVLALVNFFFGATNSHTYEKDTHFHQIMKNAEELDLVEFVGDHVIVTQKFKELRELQASMKAL